MLFEKAGENQAAIKIRGPEESRDAKHAYSLKASHVIRMPDERLPKKVFYGEVQEGNYSQGDQKKRYKDILKASLKEFYISIGSWRKKCTGATNLSGEISMKKRESVLCACLQLHRFSFLHREISAGNAKPRPIGHQIL